MFFCLLPCHSSFVIIIKHIKLNVLLIFIPEYPVTPSLPLKQPRFIISEVLGVPEMWEQLSLAVVAVKLLAWGPVFWRLVWTAHITVTSGKPQFLLHGPLWSIFTLMPVFLRERIEYHIAFCEVGRGTQLYFHLTLCVRNKFLFLPREGTNLPFLKEISKSLSEGM